MISVSKNTFALEIEYFGFCGYDYRVDTQDGETLGYLSHDDQGSWMFSTGSTPSEAKTSDPVSYEDYTLSEVKEELELEFMNS